MNLPLILELRLDCCHCCKMSACSPREYPYKQVVYTPKKDDDTNIFSNFGENFFWYPSIVCQQSPCAGVVFNLLGEPVAESHDESALHIKVTRFL